MSGETSSTSSSKKSEKAPSSTFKSLFPSGYKIPSLPTDVVTKLKGQENYEEWAAHIQMMLKAISAYRIICEGQTLDAKSDEEEKQLFRIIHSQAKLLIVNMVEKGIILTIIKITTCYEIGNHLKAAYYRDTAIDTVGQMRTVFSTVEEKYDVSQPIDTFISLFKTE